MKKMTIELWSDSFHEGDWCGSHIAEIFRDCYPVAAVSCRIVKGFQPEFTIRTPLYEFTLVVYGSYRSWAPIPAKITEILKWGKPDFIAYDPESDRILFAVEETAATATGNQTAQRCERQYGSLRFHIPYWYLVSEYGMHIDGGARRDSIWPIIAALKLSIRQKTPCMVVHYSDIRNLEDYHAGKGLLLLFYSLAQILDSYCRGREPLQDMKPLLTEQYADMLTFLDSQWSRIVDYLPSLDLVRDPGTAAQIAGLVLGETATVPQLRDFLHWPLVDGLPQSIRERQRSTPLLKYDKLCFLMEQDVSVGRCYTLSGNSGSGKPRSAGEIRGYVEAQRRHFSSEGLDPPAYFTMDAEDFPFTNETKRFCHITTAKNIVYLYDRWDDFKASAILAYPRLSGKLDLIDGDMPAFIYVSNSVKFGRIFGDPFTGQLAAFSTAFGKFDGQPRAVAAYFPHQVHSQLSAKKLKDSNKGLTLMKELTDLLIFHGGVAASLQKGEIY